MSDPLNNFSTPSTVSSGLSHSPDTRGATATDTPTRQLILPGILPERRPPTPLDLAFPGAEFSVIVPDPPWLYQNWTHAKNGAARAHYDCMSLDELKALPVARIAARNCVVLLWATAPKLDEAVALLEAWGFPFVTVSFVWIKLCRDQQAGGYKPVFGHGWHSAGCCEFVLLGKRGKGCAIVRERQLVVTPEEHLPEILATVRPPRSHSVKPDEVYARIEKMYPGPHLELFARRTRRGWSVWGDEVGPWPADRKVQKPDASGGTDLVRSVCDE